MPKILIVEKDPQLKETLERNFLQVGYETEQVGTLAEALLRIADGHFDLMVMVMTLRGKEAEVDLYVKARGSAGTVPVLFLPALTRGGHSASEKSLASHGVDELRTRVNGFFERLESEKQMVRFGDLFIDPAKRVVTLMGSLLILGRKELEILTLLARRAGDIVTRDNILNSLYDNPDRYDRTVDSHMSHLRKKLREVAGPALRISSVYGLGYRLEWKR